MPRIILATHQRIVHREVVEHFTNCAFGASSVKVTLCRHRAYNADRSETVEFIRKAHMYNKCAKISNELIKFIADLRASANSYQRIANRLESALSHDRMV